MSDHHVGIELSLDVDGHLRPVRCRVEEGASVVTHAVVEVAAEGDVDLDAGLGAEATLTITMGGASARRFTLVLGSAEFSRVDEGTLRYELHLFAHPHLLAHTRDTRKYQGMSAKDIVEAVLSEHGIPHAFHLSREPKKRDYTVQYGESDLDFVSRLLEFEGIYFTFDEGGTMLLEDRSSAAEPLEGTSSFSLLDAAGSLSKGETGIFAFSKVSRARPGRVTLNDWSWKTPEKKLLASKEADRQQVLEVYEFPAGYREQGDGEVLAQLRLEAHRAQASFVEGSSNVAGFAPGRSFSFGDNGGAMFEGDYFLAAVTHEAHDVGFLRTGEAEGDDAPYKNEFRAVPLAKPFRPEVKTKRPTIPGCHTAMVRGPAGEEIHTDQFGRMKAQFHWDREAKGNDEDSRWIRPLQETATSMNLARVGWEMSVAYVDGDPDRPVAYARNINGTMPPAYGQPSNKNLMTVKTPSSPATGGYNEIKLDDSAGSQLFYWRAEKDYQAEVKNDKRETIGNDETREVDNDLSHTVGRDQLITIGHDSKETIEKDRSLTIHQKRTKTIAGSETVHVKEDLTVNTAMNETETVGGLRFTFAGGFHMPDYVGRAKEIAKGLIPDPKKAVTDALTGAKDAALGKAKEGAMDAAKKAYEKDGGLGGAMKDPGGMLGDVASGAGSAALDGALSGAKESLTNSLKSLVPDPTAIASKLTGGLSDGITFDKLADEFLVGSITRTATDKMSRTVGGAFISAGISDIKTTAAKAYAETVGGLKLTLSVTDVIGQNVGGYMALTVGGAIIRTAEKDITVSADTTKVTVGGLLGLTSTTQVHLKSKQIAITGLTELDLSVKGAGLVLDGAGVRLKGAVQVKTGTEVVVTGKNNYLA
jgi:type VI secretion system secreted protein VgrG